MCKGDFLDEGDDFVEVWPKEWRLVKADRKRQTFQLWENLQNLDMKTLELMSKGFIQEMLESPDDDRLL